MILTQIYDSGTNFKISNFNSSYMKKINNFVIGRNDFRSQSDVIMKNSASSYGLLPRHGAGLVFAIIFWWLPANVTDAAEPYAAGPSVAGTEVQADRTVREILSSAALENTVTGILAVSASGDTILAYNCDKNMVHRGCPAFSRKRLQVPDGTGLQRGYTGWCAPRRPHHQRRRRPDSCGR